MGEAFDDYGAEEPTGSGMALPGELLQGEDEPAPEMDGEAKPEPEHKLAREVARPRPAPAAPQRPEPAKRKAPRPQDRLETGAFTGKVGRLAQARRLTGRIVLRRGRELVLEILVSGGELAWTKPVGAAVVARDGGSVPAQARAEGTTADGTYPEGVWLRVVLELSSDAEHPVEVTLTAGGEPLVVAIEG